MFDIQLLDHLARPAQADSDDEIDPDEIEFANRKQPQGTTKEESSKPGEDADPNDDEYGEEEEEHHRNSDNDDVELQDKDDEGISGNIAVNDESDDGQEDDVGAEDSFGGSTNRKVRV